MSEKFNGLEAGPERVANKSELEPAKPARVDALLALGMGPVRPQLRGRPDVNNVRRPVADFERMRAISIATKELAANGYISPEGLLFLVAGPRQVMKLSFRHLRKEIWLLVKNWKKYCNNQDQTIIN